MVTRRIPRVLLALAVALTAVAALAITPPQLPPVLAPFFAAILQKESSGQPWTIYDNTERRSYTFSSRASAEQRAGELLAMRHNIDVGLYQLNFKYQGSRPGVSLSNIFDPAVNEAIARTVLYEFYQAAQAVYARTEDAVRMAIGAYNNGRVRVHNPTYVNSVYRLAGLSPPYASEGIVQSAASASTQFAADGPARSRYAGVDARSGGRSRWNGGDEEAGSAPADASSAAQATTEKVVSAVGVVLTAAVVVAALALLAKLLLPLIGKALATMLKRALLRAAARKANETRQRATNAASGGM